MGPKSEELWSYMTGLAPLGEPFHLNRRWLEEDIGIKTRSNMCQLVNRLIWAGCIRKLGGGIYEVLERPGPTYERKKEIKRRLIRAAGC